MSGTNKVFFALAAYNTGPARVAELRKISAARGYNPNLWFSNVETVALERVGREPVQYVGNIYKYYLAYQLLEKERSSKKEARQTITRQ